MVGKSWSNNKLHSHNETYSHIAYPDWEDKTSNFTIYITKVNNDDIYFFIFTFSFINKINFFKKL